MPGAPVAHNRAMLEALFSDTADGRTRRVRLQEFFNTLRMEFAAADIELGFEYGDSPVVVADGSPAPPRDPAGHELQQSTRPGHRLPHAWLDRLGERVATHDLVRAGHFLLLAGEHGDAWTAAAGAVATQRGVPIDAYRAGPGGELHGGDGSWYGLRGHDAAGAILVRPDGHVAFRAATGATDAHAALEAALDVALAAAAPPPLPPPSPPNGAVTSVTTGSDA
jgi:2,4-dichlorophenol 6-monooxygenase